MTFFAPGDTLHTQSGRPITFPPAGPAYRRLRQIDEWLLVEARQEADARRDALNPVWFPPVPPASRARKYRPLLTAGERTALNLYLFGELEAQS